MSSSSTSQSDKNSTTRKPDKRTKQSNPKEGKSTRQVVTTVVPKKSKTIERKPHGNEEKKKRRPSKLKSSSLKGSSLQVSKNQPVLPQMATSPGPSRTPPPTAQPPTSAPSSKMDSSRSTSGTLLLSSIPAKKKINFFNQINQKYKQRRPSLTKKRPISSTVTNTSKNNSGISLNTSGSSLASLNVKTMTVSQVVSSRESNSNVRLKVKEKKRRKNKPKRCCCRRPCCCCTCLVLLIALVIGGYFLFTSRIWRLNSFVLPCDDFYEHACGNLREKMLKWKDVKTTTSLAEASSLKLLYSYMRDQKLKPGSTSKSGALKYFLQMYYACEAEKFDMRNGVRVAVQELLGGVSFPIGDKAETVPDWKDLHAEYILATGRPCIAQIEPIRDLNSGEVFRIMISSPLNEKFPADFKKTTSNLALIYGVDNQMDGVAKEIVEFEKKLAEHQSELPNWYKSGDQASFYRAIHAGATTVSNLKATLPDWSQVLSQMINKSNATNLGEGTPIYLLDSTYLKHALTVISTTTKQTLANYIAYRYAVHLATKYVANEAKLDHRFFNCFRMFETEPTYTFVIGRLFLDAYVDSFGQDGLATVRKEATAIVSDLQDVFNVNLQNTSWMTYGSQQRALKKLKALKSVVAYEDWLLVDTNLDEQHGVDGQFEFGDKGFVAGERKWIQHCNKLLYRNLKNANFWLLNSLILYGSPLYKATAHYFVQMNALTISLGYLQLPLFDTKTDPALNYGSLGSVIGHQLMHGFDSNGRLFSEIGHWQDWWDKETSEQFQERAKCFEQLYSEITDKETGLKLNGTRTLCENIADNGGLQSAYLAFTKHHKPRSAILPGEYNGYTNDEKFFFAYAHNWCSLKDVEAEKYHLEHDYHSLAKYRVNVVLANFKPFARTFKCANGTKMNPPKQCAVW